MLTYLRVVIQAAEECRVENKYAAEQFLVEPKLSDLCEDCVFCHNSGGGGYKGF